MLDSRGHRRPAQPYSNRLELTSSTLVARSLSPIHLSEPTAGFVSEHGGGVIDDSARKRGEVAVLLTSGDVSFKHCLELQTRNIPARPSLWARIWDHQVR